MFYPDKDTGGPEASSGRSGSDETSYYRGLPYPVIDDETVFRPVTGQKIRPDYVYFPANSPLLRLNGPLVRTKKP
jgi:hypothetical protein